ncbi:hypothetical protein D3C72_2184080 [compost metagenome]
MGLDDVVAGFAVATGHLAVLRLGVRLPLGYQQALLRGGAGLVGALLRLGRLALAGLVLPGDFFLAALDGRGRRLVGIGPGRRVAG